MLHRNNWFMGIRGRSCCVDIEPNNQYSTKPAICINRLAEGERRDTFLQKKWNSRSTCSKGSFHDSISQNRAAAALSPLFLYSSIGRLGWAGTDILNTKLGWDRYILNTKLHPQNSQLPSKNTYLKTENCKHGQQKVNIIITE